MPQNLQAPSPNTDPMATRVLRLVTAVTRDLSKRRKEEEAFGYRPQTYDVRGCCVDQGTSPIHHASEQHCMATVCDELFYGTGFMDARGILHNHLQLLDEVERDALVSYAALVGYASWASVVATTANPGPEAPQENP